MSSKGNNLHEVQTAKGEHYLVSMPTKFRKNVWIKRGILTSEKVSVTTQHYFSCLEIPNHKIANANICLNLLSLVFDLSTIPRRPD